MRGRPPKPTQITRVSGSDAPPDPPEFLGEAAKTEWRRLAPLLHKDGVLDAERDFGSFTGLMLAWQLMVDALAKLAADGMTYRAGNLMKRNPAAAQADQAIKTYAILAQPFGLTPASRKRLGVVVDQVSAKALKYFHGA